MTMVLVLRANQRLLATLRKYWKGPSFEGVIDDNLPDGRVFHKWRLSDGALY